MNNKKKLCAFLTDILVYIIGSILYSVAVSGIISANKISPGGFTGIATLLDYLFSLPSGITLFLLNIPVIILGLVKFGGFFIVKTAIATAIVSFTLTLTDYFIPEFIIDKVLAAVFGGMLMGLGLSLIMLRGATTGGVDVIAKLVNKHFRHITVGRIILIMDGFVIFLAAAVYRDIESALYSIVSLYVSSLIMDRVLYGADNGKIIYIITSHPDEVCHDINNLIHRGVTKLAVKGGYTGKERTLLLCTVRRYEVSAVYDAINKYDRSAFIFLSDAGEIIGEGFKNFS